VSKPGDDRTSRPQKWIAGARRYQQRLERRTLVAFLLESVRRFNKIDGKHLALVITLNLFVAVIPLIIIGYAFIEAFNPRRDVGNLLVGNLHLTGSTAQIVKGTFTNASSGKSVALSISLISLLITGLDVSATAQVAYARAFTMAPLRGIQKYLRGAAWLILLLAGTGAALTLRSVAASHSLWLAIVAGAVLVALQFGFFLVSPRLLLDLPFAWRDLVPGAAVCTGAAIVVHTVSALFLRNWFGVYGHAYGGFGISLAAASFGVVTALHNVVALAPAVAMRPALVQPASISPFATSTKSLNVLVRLSSLPS